MDFRIDPRVRDLLPALKDEEYKNLEREILDEGKIKEPLTVYDGVLIDGHHRYEIAQKHNLQYEVVERDFDSWRDAIDWMIKHQKARRNLSKTQDATVYADAEELVSSLKAEARAKKVEDGKRTGALAHKKKDEGFPPGRKTLDSPQPPTPVNPQAYVPIQEVHMPEPTVSEQRDKNQVEAPKPQARQSSQHEPQPRERPTVTPAQDAPKPEPKPKPVHTNKILAEMAGVGHATMDRVMAVKKSGNQELYDKMKSGDITAKKAYGIIQREKKAEEVKKAQSYIESQKSEGSARLTVGDSVGKTVECDLLLTDPPYSTDVDDIDGFVESWLYAALDGVKPDGFAYVFIGAYPEELRAYLNADIPEHIELCQVLVWTYKNTLGNNPKSRYKLNWQACLFYRGVDAPDLDCPLTNEQWAVQEVNAPDGRQGDRYHAWQKPLELCERFIRHSTKKGDTVYDPFSCTGTTLVAAAKLGRHGVGYELDEKNAEIAFGRGVAREP